MKGACILVCVAMVTIAQVYSKTKERRKLIHDKCYPIRWKCKHLGQNPAQWDYDGGCDEWYVSVLNRVIGKPPFAYAKTKMKISLAVTVQLSRAYIFAT